MSKQIVPASLRESMHEAVERLSARVAILLYLDKLPPDDRAPDFIAFRARLTRERDVIETLIAGVLDEWRDGRLSLAAASNVLHTVSEFVKTSAL